MGTSTMNADETKTVNLALHVLQSPEALAIKTYGVTHQQACAMLMDFAQPQPNTDGPSGDYCITGKLPGGDFFSRYFEGHVPTAIGMEEFERAYVLNLVPNFPIV